MWSILPSSCLFRPCARLTVTFAPRTVSHIERPIAVLAQYYGIDCRQHARASTVDNLAKLSKAHRVFPIPRRRFSTSSVAMHGHLTPPKPGEERKVTFIDKEGQEHTFEVADGDNLLDIAQSEDLEMEGACGGSCACSTCHVIVEQSDVYDKMVEPDDDENDMLDLAFGLTETSRLGCQVKMSKELDGMRVRLPSMTRNLQASDFSGAKKA